MPDITISASADQLVTPQDMFDLWAELEALGWYGSIGTGRSLYPGNDPVRTLTMFVDDDSAVDGVRSIKATLGDYRVLIGTTYSTMTAEAYAAAYGG